MRDGLSSRRNDLRNLSRNKLIPADGSRTPRRSGGALRPAAGSNRETPTRSCRRRGSAWPGRRRRSRCRSQGSDRSRQRRRGSGNQEDLCRPSGGRREVREVDRAGCAGGKRRDGQRRHQKLDSLVADLVQGDDGDRQAGAESEGAPHLLTAVERILVQESPSVPQLPA